MEIIGKFIQLGESKEGQGANGAWQKQDIIIETIGDSAKLISVSCWGGLADAARSMQAGQIVELIVSVESREFNGRWYTDVKLIRFGQGQRTAQPQQPQPQRPMAQQPAQKQVPMPPVTEQYLKQGGDTANDLPF